MRKEYAQWDIAIRRLKRGSFNTTPREVWMDRQLFLKAIDKLIADGVLVSQLS